MSYADRVGRAPAPASPLGLLVFVGPAVVLSAVRLLETNAAVTGGLSTLARPALTQTWVFAAIWIATYLAEAVAGWLLWRHRAKPYGRAALIVFCIVLVLQGLRLLNLLGSRLTAGQVPWSAFGTVVLLDVVFVVGALTAWQVSRRAGVILWVVLAWLLYITALTGADALLRNGLPLS